MAEEGHKDSTSSTGEKNEAKDAEVRVSSERQSNLRLRSDGY